MGEFPQNPSKRELERQQAISSIISGMAYTAVKEQLDPQKVQLERTEEAQRGFNYATYVEATGDV